MSEQTYMYEQETAVAALHQVEGFDPRKFMRLIQKEDQSTCSYAVGVHFGSSERIYDNLRSKGRNIS